ncbi:unnamed protein product [Calypogeia fissa]
MEVVSTGQDKDSAVAEERAHVVKCAEEAQVRASAELLRNLRLMVNKPAFSDVVFLCSDGKRVPASRILLTGRSEVLKSMFMNGMAESSLSEIRMPEISSPVLLAVFEFFYTGTLFDHQPQDWRVACEVILASRFFLLPDLEMITRKFMHSLTSAVVDDLPRAAAMLTEAVAMKSLCDETDENLIELVTILSSNWSESMYIKSLSENAVDYVLRNSGGNCEHDGKFSFEEYLRFRQVIRWWLYQNQFGSHGTEKLLTIIAPDVEEALSLCRDPDKCERIKCPPEDDTCLVHDWNCWRVDEASRNAAMRLMSNIDCRRIHPALLAKVVEPLEVISAVEILNCFRFLALKPMIFTLPECCWKHVEQYESYCTSERHYVLQKTQNRVGLAVMTAAMSRSYGVHQWSFVIDETVDSFAEIGFIYYASTKLELDGERLSDQYGARVLKFEGHDVSVSTKRAGGLMEWKVLMGALNEINSLVVFNYNAFVHSCSLSIGGIDFGNCWEHLPSEVYYPAVCLGTGSRGRVRIELVSGFDIV